MNALALQLLRRHRQKNTGGSSITSEEVCSLQLVCSSLMHSYETVLNP
jgi:hypothetical protein